MGSFSVTSLGGGKDFSFDSIYVLKKGSLHRPSKQKFAFQSIQLLAGNCQLILYGEIVLYLLFPLEE